MYDSVKGESREANQDARLCWVQCRSVEAVKRDQSLNKQNSSATGGQRHKQRGVEKDHEKRKKERNQSNCEKSGGGLSETGHGKEGRVDSHGPVFVLVLPCPCLLCVHALGPGCVEVVSEPVLRSASCQKPSLLRPLREI